MLLKGKDPALQMRCRNFGGLYLYNRHNDIQTAGVMWDIYNIPNHLNLIAIQMSVTHIALWLLWHSVSSILGSGLGPLGMWFGLGTSSSSGCCSPIWGSLRSLPTVAPPERLSGSDFTSSGIPVTRCLEEWWCGPGKYSHQNSMYCTVHTFVPDFK